MPPAAITGAYAQVPANGTAYLEVHVSTPVEVASVRDVKGLYARQRVGEISGLTGVDDPYEEPLKPDLVIAAHEVLALIWAFALPQVLTRIGQSNATSAEEMLAMGSASVAP